MALYTVEEAIERAKILSESDQSVEVKKQGLLDIIANLDSAGDTPSGKTTVLYSGKINGESMADFVVLKSDANVRHIGKTDVGRFVVELSIEDYGNQQILQDILEVKRFDDPKLESFLYYSKNRAGGADGLWDTASRRFAEATEGNVVVLAGKNINPDGILYSTELKSLDASKITAINGFDFNEVMGRNADEALRILNTSAIQRYYISLHAGSPLTIDKVTLLQDLDDFPGINTAAQLEIDDSLKDISSEERLKFSKLLNKLGPIGLVLGFTIASTESANAYNAGNEQKAKEIMIEWAADEAGATVGGIAGAALAGVALALAAPVGAVLGTILVVGASIAGAFIGGDFAVDFYRNNLKDLDNNGQIDMFDKFSNIFFGVGTLEENLPRFSSLGNRVNLDSNLEINEIVSNAKTSHAWAYALKYLNPFVIEGISYDLHNLDGSLNVSNLSDTY